MVKVWKCGTNWGGHSVLEYFIDLRIVFFGTDVMKVGHCNEVKPGDIMCIADGTTILAISKVVSPFRPLRDVRKNVMPKFVKDEFAESGVEPVGCEISDIHWLDVPIIHDRRGGRFYQIPSDRPEYSQVLETFKAFSQPRERAFDISSGKKCLVADNETGGLIFGKHYKYVIPVYQRPYAWGETEILRLLDCIMTGFNSNDPQFAGSIQVSSPVCVDCDREIYRYELIDGQQRFTTLLILLKLLGEDYTSLLRSAVDAGSAQRDWDEFNSFDLTKDNGSSLNNYLVAARIIRRWITEALPENQSAAFVEYVKQSLYFVSIQTAASISKTLQIFNVINTSGMDLNTSDLFKIRFYDYLTKNTGPDEDAFNAISACYKKVADYNRRKGWVALSMDEVLAFLQQILVAKFELGAELFEMSSQRFYERLFDTLLGEREWQGFAHKGISVGIEDFQRVVDCFEQLLRESDQNIDLRLARRFLWETRYGHTVRFFPALALYFNSIADWGSMGLVRFTFMLFKKLVPSSMKFAKIVSGIKTGYLLKLLYATAGVRGSVHDVFDLEWKTNGLSEKEMLKQGLAQPIAGSRTWKGLACKIVEFLASKWDKLDGMEKQKLYGRLFETSYDIEHVQSYTDEKERETIWASWGDQLDSLGNLSMLEYEINRSIQNKAKEKKTAYFKSAYQSIREIWNQMPENGEWTIDQARDRGVNKRTEITDFIFGKGMIA